MGPRRRLLPVAILVLVVLGAAGPARASEIIVVDGPRAVKRADPFMPAGSAGEIGQRIGTGPRRAAMPRATPRASAARVRGGVAAVLRALRRAVRAHTITVGAYAGFRRDFARARSVRRRLHGARGRQLAYVLTTVERIARAGRLIPSRMPALFLELRRNTQYWPSKPFPAAKQKVRFRGSELLFQ